MLGAAFSLTYGMGFAGLASTLVHVALFYGSDIIARTKDAAKEPADVHLKLMRKYKEAPEWWFGAIFLLSFVFGMVASQVWETHLTWWAYILCIFIGVFFILPVGECDYPYHEEATSNVNRHHPSRHQPANRSQRRH